MASAGSPAFLKEITSGDAAANRWSGAQYAPANITSLPQGFLFLFLFIPNIAGHCHNNQTAMWRQHTTVQTQWCAF